LGFSNWIPHLFLFFLAQGNIGNTKGIWGNLNF
jgi:hypothetical protein